MPNIANISNNILTDSGVATSSLQPTITLTTTGTSGASTLISNTLNIPNYGSALTGYVPTSRQLTINGTAYDLSVDRTWSVGTVTSVSFTLGGTGTDLNSSVTNSTTTPAITLNVPTASAANRGALSAADWSTFNTKVGGVTATTPLFSSGGSTPNLTIQQSSGSQAGYLSSTDWTTFNNKQAAGNYITSLTGEATATGPGAAAVTLDNAAVTGKILTGVNITGGTILSTDSILTGFGKLQNQVNGLIGGSIYQGTWNANTNTPTLTSSVGTAGYYYIVSVAGTTNLNGITDWQVGDWAIFNGGVWQKVDNTDSVISVNGQTGAVSLTTDNISEGVTNLYFTNTRARAALSFVAGSGAYNSSTGVITIPTNTSQLTNGANFITLVSLSGTAPISYNSGTGAISITQSGTASNGYLSSTDWNTFNNKQATLSLTTTGTSGAATLVGATLNIPNYGSALSGYVPTSRQLTINGTAFDLSADRSWSVGTVTSVAATGGTGITISGSPITTSGTLTITNSAPDQVVALTASTGISVSGTYPNFTITNTSPSSGGTVTSVAALTIGTSGTDLSSSVANSTTTPVITLNVPTASATNRGALSSADWTTFNSKQGTITLTTTGTSGAATFSANTLNIPNYGSALSGYLPLTGGTLTGALSGTSATFSGDVTANRIYINSPSDVAGALQLKMVANTINQGIFLQDSTQSTAIKLWAEVGKGHLDVTSTGTEPLFINSGGGVVLIGTTTVSGAAVLQVTGAATFSSSVTATSESFITSGDGAGKMLKFTGGTTKYNFMIAVQQNVNNALEITPSTAAGGSTFSTPALTIASTGAATFSSSVTSSGTITAKDTTNDASVLMTGLDGAYGLIQANNAAGSLTKNLVLQKYGGNVGIGTVIPSTKLEVNGFGTANSIMTYPCAKFYGGGTGGINIGTDGTYAMIATDTSGADMQFLTRVAGVFYPRITITSGGNVLIGTTTNDTGKLQVNGIIAATAADAAVGLKVIGGTGRLVIFPYFDATYGVLINSYNTAESGYKPIGFQASAYYFLQGAATFNLSVTASSFFESSDSRLKTIIQDNYQTKGIASITPKLYTKNGKVELGYYAQDFVGVLDSAVSKGSDDMLSLSYREVHTAKIYALEQEIKELKAKLN